MRIIKESGCFHCLNDSLVFLRQSIHSSLFFFRLLLFPGFHISYKLGMFHGQPFRRLSFGYRALYLLEIILRQPLAVKFLGYAFFIYIVIACLVVPDGIGFLWSTVKVDYKESLISRKFLRSDLFRSRCDLLNERVMIQFFRVNRLPVYNTALGQSFPDSDGVHIIQIFLLGLGIEPVLLNELGNPALYFGPGQLCPFGEFRANRQRTFIVPSMKFTGQP